MARNPLAISPNPSRIRTARIRTVRRDAIDTEHATRPPASGWSVMIPMWHL
jgi:hypothetical protein